MKNLYNKNNNIFYMESGDNINNPPMASKINPEEFSVIDYFTNQTDHDDEYYCRCGVCVVCRRKSFIILSEVERINKKYPHEKKYYYSNMDKKYIEYGYMVGSFFDIYFLCPTNETCYKTAVRIRKILTKYN